MHTNTQNSLSAKTVKCCRILGEYIYGHFGNKDSLSEMLSKTLKELLKQGDGEGSVYLEQIRNMSFMRLKHFIHHSTILKKIHNPKRQQSKVHSLFVSIIINIIILYKYCILIFACLFFAGSEPINHDKNNM